MASLLLAIAILGACGRGAEPDSAGDLAVLASSVEGFREASPDTRLSFPDDHGEHRDFRIEWWYLTANLQDARGRPFGAQWTLFRIAQRPPAQAGDNPWQDSQVYMAHFALSTESEHVSFQRYARGGEHGGLARAGATSAPFNAWLDDWYLRSTNGEQGVSAGTGGAEVRGAAGPWLPLQAFARQSDYALQLTLRSDRAPVLQGDRGFSRKHPSGSGSHYYSHPFLEASGEIMFRGERVPVTGDAWLDREWSSQFLQADQAGWDWFALHLDSGEKLMLFRLRALDERDAGFRHGVLIGPGGERRELDPQSIDFVVLERTSVAGRRIPTRWRVKLPELDRELLIEALHPQQWMDVDFAYWEGYVVARGSGPGEAGRGYLEMVGYGGANQTTRPPGADRRMGQ